MPDLVYLASPHSHPELDVREHRFLEACRCAGALLSRGVMVFSPIAHSHQMSELCQIGVGQFDFWRDFDMLMLSKCQALYVLTIDGWEKSVGVEVEISEAHRIDIPVYKVTVNGDAQPWLNGDARGGSATTRKLVLDRAAECVLKNRADAYGPPERSFDTISELWRGYLRGKNTWEITAVDVAAMLALLKIARVRANPERVDNWVDLAGYAACGGEIAGAK